MPFGSSPRSVSQGSVPDGGTGYVHTIVLRPVWLMLVDPTGNMRPNEDYMLEGPLTALDVIGVAAGEREVNAIGYCLGGTITSGICGRWNGVCRFPFIEMAVKSLHP
jgi:hypothetical protein